jgi:hypothetical protein
VSDEDLHHSIARHIESAIPGMPLETYLRAAKGAASMWRDEWRKGYKAGKESGLMESTHGGEIAMLRERIKRYENAAPEPHSKEVGE